jgi:tetratricopeptide (TPR) repeat protein
MGLVQVVSDPSAKSGTLTVLGHYLEREGDPAAALDSYEQALRIFREVGEEHHALESLAGMASASLSLGDLERAQVHVEEVLAHLEKGGTLPTWSRPVWIHLICYQVLVAANDPRAGDVLRKAYDLLMEYADRISDEAMHRSFLENVPWHREIVELVEKSE